MKKSIAVLLLMMACSNRSIQEPTTSSSHASGTGAPGITDVPDPAGDSVVAVPSTGRSATPQFTLDGPSGCVTVSRAPLQWTLTMSDSGPSGLRVVAVAHQAPEAGCLRPADNPRERARITGVVVYPGHTAGRTMVSVDPAQVPCGRIRLDVAIVDAQGHETRVLGVVIEAPAACAPAPDAGPDIEAVLVGAGDIGWCQSDGRPDLTAALLDGIGGTVFTTGDNAYMNGSAEAFRRCYDPSWGRHRGRTRPTPGNHDYETAGATGYYGYFGANAGPSGVGYYSYRLGAWHILALNSQVDASMGSAQVAWLRAELAAHQTRCTLAYFHEPLFGSGTNGSDPRMRDVWRVLYLAGVDVVLSGHNHSYERFAEQDPDGRVDPARGIREFVVGTGGAPLTGFPGVQANSEARNSAWGVLKLTLRSNQYRWDFVPVAGQSFTDSGVAYCH